MTRTLYTLCGTDAARPFSPHAWKAVMALHHKGLTFEESPTPFTAIPDLFGGGVTKTVPVLVDGDNTIIDSFKIAEYLEETYPDAPSLFGGPGGRAMARFVEGYSQTTIHPSVTKIAILDIYNMLAPEDQAYFRSSREKLLNRTLEDFHDNRAPEITAFAEKLKPLNHMLRTQSFIGGESPLFADYIVFGALQWLRTTTTADPFKDIGAAGDWFERCLDLFGGVARAVPAGNRE